MKLTRLAASALALASAACSTHRDTCPPAKAAERAPPAASVQSPAPIDLGPPRVGEDAPDFQLPDRDGAPVQLSGLRGSLAVIHFTASWCPYCDAEIEAVQKIAETYGPRGVKVLLVDVLEKDPAWEAFKPRIAPAVMLLRDATGEVAARYAPPKAQPSFQNRAEVVLAATIVVDQDGKIRFFELIDTDPKKGFDPELSPVRARLDELLAPKTGG